MTQLSKQIPMLVGLLFVWAGGYKLLYPGEATLALYSLDVPLGLADFLVVVVIVVELYLGVLLLLKLDLKYALGVSMGLMFLFTAYMWYLSTMANPPSCGCLGLTGIFGSNKHAAFFGLFRNCLILWALKWSYDYYFKSPAPTEAKSEAEGEVPIS